VCGDGHYRRSGIMAAWKQKIPLISSGKNWISSVSFLKMGELYKELERIENDAV
jgi:hypothetical protein